MPKSSNHGKSAMRDEPDWCSRSGFFFLQVSKNERFGVFMGAFLKLAIDTPIARKI
jgi:hypothetical protein